MSRGNFTRLDPSQWRHGTFSCYNHHRCRCEVCTEFIRVFHANRRSKERSATGGKCLHCPTILESGHGTVCKPCQHLDRGKKLPKVGSMEPGELKEWVWSLGPTIQARRASLREMLQFSARDRTSAEDVGDIQAGLRLLEYVTDDPERPARPKVEVDSSEGLWPWDYWTT